MLIQRLSELPPVKRRAVIINVSTRWVTTLALLSALRYVRMPVLVIDCESVDGSFHHFKTLMKDHEFDLISAPLKVHGYTLDWVFQNLAADYILLLDSDTEIPNRTILDLMDQILDNPQLFGCGFIHGPLWLTPTWNWFKHEKIGFYQERMWIPFTILDVAKVRAALQDGYSFVAQTIFNDFPLVPWISRLLYQRFNYRWLLHSRLDFLKPFRNAYSNARPSYVYSDTGAALFHYLRYQCNYIYAGLPMEVHGKYVSHFNGITRKVLDPKGQTSATIDNIYEKLLTRLHEVYGVFPDDYEKQAALTLQPECHEEKALSVILCTHNPDRDYLERAINALRAQTLPKEQWELLLIENDSKETPASQRDLTWHPHARHIREEQLGYRAARLRGIGEAVGRVLVFVGYDCELAADFLFHAAGIAKKCSYMGAWVGQCFPVFESLPPNWTKPYWGYLGVKTFSEEGWLALSNDNAGIPPGGGLCIRKPIAEAYRRRVETDFGFGKIDRCGNSSLILNCVDLAMLLTAYDEGMSIGELPELKSNLFIPGNKIQESYISGVLEECAYTSKVIAALRGNPVGGRVLPGYRRQLGQLKRRLTMPRRGRLFFEANLRGQQQALADIKNWDLQKCTVR